MMTPTMVRFYYETTGNPDDFTYQAFDDYTEEEAAIHEAELLEQGLDFLKFPL